MSKNPFYSISQNFLTSSKTINRLIEKTDLSPQDTVLEIGAGKGHITRVLAQRCRTVIAYEIDPRLYEGLKQRVNGNVRLFCADFLKAPLPEPPYKVFANIPFSHTTAIMQKLTATDRLPDGLWLVMERGAAMRFCGTQLQALLLRPFFDLRIVHRFQRGDFHPAPRVDVVLLECRRKPSPDIPPARRRDFAAFLRHSLKYGLFHSRAWLTRKQISTALRLAGLPQIERSGDVLYVQWLCLFRCWLKYGKKPPAP